jgi:hypothetical protein
MVVRSLHHANGLWKRQDFSLALARSCLYDASYENPARYASPVHASGCRHRLARKRGSRADPPAAGHRRRPGHPSDRPVRGGDTRRRDRLQRQPGLQAPGAGRTGRCEHAVPRRLGVEIRHGARRDETGRTGQAVARRRYRRDARLPPAQSAFSRHADHAAHAADAHVLAARRRRLQMAAFGRPARRAGAGWLAIRRREKLGHERPAGPLFRVRQFQLGPARHRDGTRDRRALRPPDAPLDIRSDAAESGFLPGRFRAGARRRRRHPVPQARKGRRRSLGPERPVDRPGRRFQRRAAGSAGASNATSPAATARCSARKAACASRPPSSRASC